MTGDEPREGVLLERDDRCQDRDEVVSEDARERPARDATAPHRLDGARERHRKGGAVVVKLFLVDLAGLGTVARILSFIVVGLLMLLIGYLSPLPPRAQEGTPR